MNSPALATPADPIVEAPPVSSPPSASPSAPHASRASWVPLVEVSAVLLILLAMSAFLYALLGAVCCGR
jgi:hypothetical protein